MNYRMESDEAVRLLALCESRMDAGLQPYVRDPNGARWATTADVLEQVGCINGQTVSDAQINHMQQLAMAEWLAEMTINKARKVGGS